jgi:hypothetical protein
LEIIVEIRILAMLSAAKKKRKDLALISQLRGNRMGTLLMMANRF